MQKLVPLYDDEMPNAFGHSQNPQRRAKSETIDTSGVHREKGGEAPTVALQSSTTSN
jgi:hypothetical protein